MNDESTKQPKFEAIARGSAFASIESKLVNYVSIADRRAQGLLGIAAFLVPLSLTQLDTVYSQPGVVIFLAFATLTILFCILVLSPKRYGKIYSKTVPGGSPLHFAHIAKYEEEEYVEKMAGLSKDMRVMTEVMTRDFYHMSKYVIRPKFRWLRIAYTCFLLGLVLGLGAILVGFFFYQ